jgi:hypothetical protein
MKANSKLEMSRASSQQKWPNCTACRQASSDTSLKNERAPAGRQRMASCQNVSELSLSSKLRTLTELGPLESIRLIFPFRLSSPRRPSGKNQTPARERTGVSWKRLSRAMDYCPAFKSKPSQLGHPEHLHLKCASRTTPKSSYSVLLQTTWSSSMKPFPRLLLAR